MAASVGDSLLDSIAAGRDRSSTDTRTARGEGERDLDNAPSWADPVLPPDQVLCSRCPLVFFGDVSQN